MGRVVYNSEEDFTLDEYLAILNDKPKRDIENLDEEIRNFELWINRVIRSYDLGSKNINVVVNKNDRIFIEMVIDYIKNTLYPMYKDTMICVDPNTSSFMMNYYESHNNDPDAFPYTDILDIELHHLLTCIKIADRSDKPFKEFINVFDYSKFDDEYNFIYTCFSEFFTQISYVNDIFTEEDLLNIILKLSSDELLVLEAFADAKLEVPTMQKNRDELEMHNRVNGFIHHARVLKENEAKKSIFSRLRSKLEQKRQ